MRNNLRIIKRKTRTHLVTLFNTYEQRDLPGWRGWIASKLWSVLHRMGATGIASEKIETLTYGEIEQKRVTDTIFYGIEEVMSHSEWGGSPDDFCIVMGGADFAELLHTAPFDMVQMTVPAADAFRANEGGYRAKLSGYPIHIVPWLKGHAILPRVVVEKRKPTPAAAREFLDARSE